MNEQLKRRLMAQFYRGNHAAFALAVFASLGGGTMNLLLSWIIQQLIDTISGEPNALSLSALGVISLGFVLLCAALSLLKCAAEPRFVERALRQYRDFAFERLLEKRISSFRDEQTAAYLSALTNDAASIEADYLAQQFSVITMAVTFVGALVMMLCCSPLMTAVAVGLTLLPLAASLLTGKWVQAAERRVSDANQSFTAALADCLGGFSVVKTFRAEREILRLFAESNRALEGEKFHRRRLRALVGIIGSVAGVVAQLGVFLVGAYMALSGRGITAGGVILFVNLMNFVIDPIAELPALLAGYRAALGLIDKLAQALAQHAAAAGGVQLSHLERGVLLRDVSFSYDGQRQALQGVSASFEAGKAYAIVGCSGSGKSTLLNLLMVGGTDYGGSILLDDTELSAVAPESLYALMSVIEQRVFIFNASIRDNVTMFRSFPQAQLDAAIARAQLGGLLEQRGADYRCGEGGSGLSGGEKQRVSIARSLLKRASVLLADEATAALDAETAHQVTSDVLELTGVTRIIVTHALEESLLRRFDGIFVMKDGCIVELGSFDALMARRGYFHALFTVAQ